MPSTLMRSPPTSRASEARSSVVATTLSFDCANIGAGVMSEERTTSVTTCLVMCMCLLPFDASCVAHHLTPSRSSIAVVLGGPRLPRKCGQSLPVVSKPNLPLFGSCRRAAPPVLGPTNAITADGPARRAGRPAVRRCSPRPERRRRALAATRLRVLPPVLEWMGAVRANRELELHEEFIGRLGLLRVARPPVH